MISFRLSLGNIRMQYSKRKYIVRENDILAYERTPFGVLNLDILGKA